ncbi:MAG TPA: signal peptidase I [Symbiobacteriaceae bacterium]
MKTATKALLIAVGVLILLGSASLYVWFFRSTKAYIMDGESMVPTLKQGDRFMTRKYSYSPTFAAVPKRGDIIVFEWPEHPGRVLVKRVIGLPGDLLEIRQGVVYINGDRLTEPYVQNPGSDSIPPVTVLSGAVWVLGDNRSKSFDSRMFGDVPLTRVRAITVGAEL